MALSGIDAACGASPDDVVVTVGGQQALDLVARLFLDPGDVVLAEGPTYVGALGVFQAAQAQVVHVPMDDDGLIPEALEEAIAEQRARPAGQVPLHDPDLPEPGRRDADRGAARAGARHLRARRPAGGRGRPVRPAGLRRRGAARRCGPAAATGVFYLSTFSKTFAPGLRVGWILAPHAVRDKLVMASEAQILCPSAFAQAAVTQYLTTMPWREQIKAYREIYRRTPRRAARPRSAT